MCNSFNCTIILDLLESSKIILLQAQVEKIIEVKFAENGFFLLFSRDFDLNHLKDKIF